MSNISSNNTSNVANSAYINTNSNNYTTPQYPYSSNGGTADIAFTPSILYPGSNGNILLCDNISFDLLSFLGQKDLEELLIRLYDSVITFNNSDADFSNEIKGNIREYVRTKYCTEEFLLTFDFLTFEDVMKVHSNDILSGKYLKVKTLFMLK